MSRSSAATESADTAAATGTATGDELVVRARTDITFHNAEHAARVALATAHRRAVALPHIWTASTGAAGATAWGLAEAASVAGLPGLAVTAGAAVLSGTAATVGWWAKGREVAEQWRSRVATALAASGVAVPLISATGFGWGTAATLLCTEAALAARWWRHNRLPTEAACQLVDPKQALLDASGPVPAPADDPIAQKWRAKLAREKGRFAGSELYDAETTEFGTSYTLQLDGAKHNFGTVLSKIEDIAGALEVPPTMIMPSQFPDGRVDRIRLEIVTNSPISGVVPYDAPRWVDLGDGCEGMDIGPYGDGRGSALYELIRPNGVTHGHVAGDSGTGKSELLINLAVSARASGKVTIVYLDGSLEASNPVLADFADYADHGDDGAERVLLMAQQWEQWRAKENVAIRQPGFIASPERPVILIIIDEAHAVFGMEGMAAAWLEGLRRFRKYGIALLTASQGLGVADFGGNRTLRKLLISRNLFTGKTTANSEKSLVPGLDDVDPATLPMIPGWGLSGSQTHGARVAAYRAAWRKDWATIGNTLPRIPLDRLAEAAANFAGDQAGWWAGRDAEAAERPERAAAEIAALLSGTWAELSAAAEQADDTATSDTDERQAAADAPLFGTNVVLGDFARHAAALTGYTLPVPEPTPTPPDLSTAEATVWEAIRDGHTAPKQIQDFTGWSETYVRKLLHSLMDKKAIEQPRQYGPYFLAESA